MSKRTKFKKKQIGILVHNRVVLKYEEKIIIRLVKIARFLRSINRHEKDRLIGLAREASPLASRNLHDILFYDRPTADMQRLHRCTSFTVCR